MRVTENYGEYCLKWALLACYNFAGEPVRELREFIWKGLERKWI